MDDVMYQYKNKAENQSYTEKEADIFLNVLSRGPTPEARWGLSAICGNSSYCNTYQQSTGGFDTNILIWMQNFDVPHYFKA